MKYSYTDIFKCDRCGLEEYNLYFFELIAVFGLRRNFKFCPSCSKDIIDKYNMKVEVKQYE